MSKIKLYYDTLSQPSRALKLFLLVNKIPHESIAVNLAKGEHLQPEFEKINPLKKVPVLEYNGSLIRESVGVLRYLCRELDVPDHWYPKDSLKQAKVDEYLEWQHLNTRLFCALCCILDSESVGVLRYLCRELDVPDHWYPKDSLKQAKVDEYLEWQHLNTRLFCAMFFHYKILRPKFLGEPYDEKMVSYMFKGMQHSLDVLCNVWLKDSKYLCGDQITIADLLGVCELEQPRLGGYNVERDRPILKAYMNRVRGDLEPHYSDVMKRFNKFLTKYDDLVAKL